MRRLRAGGRAKPGVQLAPRFGLRPWDDPLGLRGQLLRGAVRPARPDWERAGVRRLDGWRLWPRARADRARHLAVRPGLPDLLLLLRARPADLLRHLAPGLPHRRRGGPVHAGPGD